MHDKNVCRYPVLTALCPECAKLWALVIEEEGILSPSRDDNLPE